MSKRANKHNKTNGKVANKVACAIFMNAVPSLIERWERYKSDENADITFDRFLIDIIQNYKEGEN